MSSRPWADQRGFTLAELLVAAVVGAVVLLGLFSLYRATTTAFNQSSSQAYLQRQGTLALQEITRQAQRATKPIIVEAPPVCAPAGSRSLKLQVSQTSPVASIPSAEVGYYCYWASAAGQLCEGFSASSGPTGPCRDLLASSTGLLRQTGQTKVTLILQTNPVDPRCPRNLTNPPGTQVAGGVAIAAGGRCLVLDRDAGSTKGEVAFAITNGLDGMTFTTGLMLRNSSP
jgi:prepilin-type N-terminal cleavage/methylation domain-containing protein